ncbi:MAG: GAF domain-containing protein [Candidatus Lokiarchaeota archaeon]|nr:GAF domain-containing protein [Candidatus Lokiarchaeota archaeon]
MIFKELIENISSGVAIYETPDGGKSFIIRQMNKAGSRICEVTREEIIGKNLSDLFPNVEDFGFFSALRRVWESGKPEHSPTAFYQDDRVDGWTELYIYKLSSGKVAAIFDKQSELITAEENYKKKVEFEKTVSTISSRFVNPVNIDKALKISLEEIGHLSQASRSYLFLFNDDSKTMSNTHEWCTEDVSSQIGELQNLPMETFPWSIQKIKNGEIINVDNTNRLPPEASAEKEEFLRENIKSLILLPLKIGEKISGFIGLDNVKAAQKWGEHDLNLLKIASEIIGNAIRRNETEKELEELNKELKSRFIDRTKKLEESEEKYRKAYNQANLYRDIFAHDINNMLQNIQSSAELSSLYMNNPEKLHTLKELYEIITEQIERGKKLINNVRKITKIDESEVNLEKTEVSQLLNTAVKYLTNSFQARNIEIRIDPSNNKFYVMGNDLLLDVFENILINAVRHNNKSTIKISVDISKDHLNTKDYIKMEFKDNAIGISDYRKKSIFEKGKRKSDKSKGMGLGLSLVKKIIESYNGEIWVEDRVKGDHEQGSNFVVLLQEVKQPF